VRVLLVHDYGRPTGGAELQTLALRDGLRAAGHDVRLLASRAALAPGPLVADDTCFGTTRGRLQVVSQLANPSAHAALRRAIAEHRPDVVHVRMFLAQLSPLIMRPLARVPSVFHVATYRAICPRYTKLLPDGRPCTEPAGLACLRHRCVTPQSWPLHLAQLGLWRRWRGNFDAVVTLSEAARAQLEAAGVGPVEVIPNGVADRPARPPLAGPPTIGYAGRLSPEKGVDVLLRAFARLRSVRPDARLVVAGDGPERAALGTLSRALGLDDRVEWWGHVARDELERRFDRVWVQVSPHVWAEPFGNVVTEAMVRGTAVVASRVGGPAEILDQGQTGVLVEPGHHEPLAAALDELLSDPSRLDRIGAAARRTARRRYSHAAMVANVEALHRRLVERATGERTGLVVRGARP